ncbi:hypothetical protein V9L05_18360 [Bernardetia sp. Wsw4-3y2]|uniref:hypothetical protein n=1 Tax=Bernardetia sp. Wsw4-3y2 TaxID=3127471 RepID=UPI0030CADEF3
MKKKSILFIITAILILSCENQANNIKAGSICTIENGEGKFGMVKVLVINDQEAHVKIYKNEYDQRPTKVDIKTLDLGSINDSEGGFGIGHVPLERKGFDDWKPIIVGFEEVTKDELVGYEMWNNQ